MRRTEETRRSPGRCGFLDRGEPCSHADHVFTVGAPADRSGGYLVIIRPAERRQPGPHLQQADGASRRLEHAAMDGAGGRSAGRSRSIHQSPRRKPEDGPLRQRLRMGQSQSNEPLFPGTPGPRLDTPTTSTSRIADPPGGPDQHTTPTRSLARANAMMRSPDHQCSHRCSRKPTRAAHRQENGASSTRPVALRGSTNVLTAESACTTIRINPSTNSPCAAGSPSHVVSSRPE